MPVDDFVPQALFRATVKGDPDLLDPVHEDIIAVCARRAPGMSVVPLPGDDVLQPRQGGPHHRCHQRAPALWQRHRPQGRHLSRQEPCSHDPVLRRSADRHAAARSTGGESSLLRPMSAEPCSTRPSRSAGSDVPVGFFTGLSIGLLRSDAARGACCQRRAARLCEDFRPAHDARLRAAGRWPCDLPLLRREHGRAHAGSRPTCP